MNTITISGNLTDAPKLSSTQSGKQYTRFSVAVKRPYKKDETDFFNCTAWEQTAKYLTQYAGKGDKVVVNGSMQSSSIEKDGEKRTYWGLQVSSAELCGGRSSSTESSTKGKAPDMEPVYDPDLPF